MYLTHDTTFGNTVLCPIWLLTRGPCNIGGITCNNCRTVPIRGLRYKCANCQDYDLCEGCEAAEVHIKSHVFMKIRIPIPPLANSRTKKLPPFYPGIPQGNTSTPDHLLQDLLQKTHCEWFCICIQTACIICLHSYKSLTSMHNALQPSS